MDPFSIIPEADSGLLVRSLIDNFKWWHFTKGYQNGAGKHFKSD